MTVSSTNDTAKKFGSGIFTGIFSTVLFNPYDKALYLMSSKGFSFFNRVIWEKPYQGVSQALYGRIVSYGIYFTFYDIYKEKMAKTPNSAFLAGIATGLTACILSHPLNVIKMLNWNRSDESTGLMTIGRKIYQTHGLKAIGRALHLTCMRDILFSAAYFSLNEKFNEKNILVKEIVIAMLAASLASPINYARNYSFNVFDKPAPSMLTIFGELVKEAKLLPTMKEKIGNIGYLRLGIGPGTIRVGAGMAVSRRVYNFFEETLFKD